MHGHHTLRFQFEECTNGFLRGHVYRPPAGRVVRTNGQQRNFGRKPLSDLGEPVKIRAVAGMQHGSPAQLQVESAKPATVIMENPGTPVLAGSQRHSDLADRQGFPWKEFMHTLKAQVEHQVTYAARYNSRLSICNLPQRAPIEVIEVGMGYKHEVDLRQVIHTDAGTLDSFQHFQPKRPDR